MWNLRTVRILDPIDGDILNRNDGDESENKLQISLRGVAPVGSKVEVNGTKAETNGETFSCSISLRQHVNKIVAEARAPGFSSSHEITLLWDRKSFKRYRIQTDDNIIWLYDLAKNVDRYSSIFDNDYMAFWKEMHDKYGIKVQHNIYYQAQGFNLSQMPEKYKNEFQENSDWIKLTMHAFSHSPARPYLSATYQQMQHDYLLIVKEIVRFAGPQLLSCYSVIHWAEATLEACRALRDHGVIGLRAPFGVAQSDDGRPIACYYLGDTSLIKHVSGRDYWKDIREDIIFVNNALTLDWHDLSKLDLIKKDPKRGEICDIVVHEYSFHPSCVRPDPCFMKEKVSRAIEWVTKNGYKPVFYDQGFIGNTNITSDFLTK